MGGGGGDFGNCFCFKLGKRIGYGLLTCTMALGGASVGIIVGAIKGQTAETGFLGGAWGGAMFGAITAVQLLDRMVNGDPFSKVTLLYSILSGKVFRDWVTPSVLQDYQWQISRLEANFIEISDIFEIHEMEGLSKDIIKTLPTSRFYPNKTQRPFQDFKKGEFTRMLPSCGHTFHKNCTDEWLTRHGSCPICRREI